MQYQRKTKDVFLIIWNGEEIDEFDNRDEARRMRKEYNLAFRGGCWIQKKRVKL